MKLLNLSLCLILLPAGNAFSQDAPSDVTDAQIKLYQSSIEGGCKSQGRLRGAPAEKVDAFCECAMKILGQDTTLAEWKEAAFYASKKDAEKAQAIMAPHMKKVSACNSAL
jgi:hypothetical protein